MKLAQFCKTLESRLATVDDTEQARQLAALALQQAFKTEPDEIAFLAIDQARETLHFSWPPKLCSAGSIPLNTKDSLAANTARENQPTCNNRFAATYHASIFEQIRLDVAEGPDQRSQQPIQKIMSVPICRDDQVTGVVQVCRKGESDNQAGADFSQAELDALHVIAGVIGGYI